MHQVTRDENTLVQAHAEPIDIALQYLLSDFHDKHESLSERCGGF